MSEAAVLARVVRSGLEESVHLGHVAVCDASGRRLVWAGDSERRLFARSSMKPLQAAVSAFHSGEELDDAELAIMCASHAGEPVHIKMVDRILVRAGMERSRLQCPPAWPRAPEDAIAAGMAAPVFHNCSGKHAGMLLACVRRGWDVDSYLSVDHPLQRRVLEAVRAGAVENDIAVGIDGCGAPVHGMRLSALAVLFAKLGSPDHWGDLGPWVARCTTAMGAHPNLVAGRERLDTDLMTAAGGVVVKGGAEGLVAATVPERGVGIAVKVADGSYRAAGAALLAILAELGFVTERELDALADHYRPPVSGGGRRVGEVYGDVGLVHA